MCHYQRFLDPLWVSWTFGNTKWQRRGLECVQKEWQKSSVVSGYRQTTMFCSNILQHRGCICRNYRSVSLICTGFLLKPFSKLNILNNYLSVIEKVLLWKGQSVQMKSLCHRYALLILCLRNHSDGIQCMLSARKRSSDESLDKAEMRVCHYSYCFYYLFCCFYMVLSGLD